MLLGAVHYTIWGDEAQEITKHTKNIAEDVNTKPYQV
jgi:uncharacterized protein YoxC